MIIHKDGERLMQAGTVTVVDCDDYSVAIEVKGFDDASGDFVTYRLALSRNEVRTLGVAAARRLAG